MEILPEIDGQLNEKMSGWSTDRIGKVELTILRIALYEMNEEKKVSCAVAINEAVELAKLYGGEQSSGFVNGVLAKIVKGLEPDDGNQST
jgi:N utilization substance protein B